LFALRPRITISIIAPNTEFDQEIINYDLPPDLSVAGLKNLVEDEKKIPPASQQYYLNNTPVQGDEKTLEEAGIKDGDMLAMLMRQPQQENSMGSQRRQPSAQRRVPVQAEQEVERTRQNILQNPGAMAQVREQRPALADAVNDPAAFREAWMEMIRADDDREQERLEQMRLLNEDPFNVDAQRKIEEMIRQQQVQDNLQFAYEHNPEGESPPYSELLEPY
jgi:DNA damage-inducible protein 1